MKVGRLIKELQKFDPEAYAYAYEGEVTGIIIVDKDFKHLGYIKATEIIKEEE